MLPSNLIKEIKKWYSVVAWYSMVHTSVLQIEIKHFLANLQGGKPKKDRNTEFFKKRQVETGRFIVRLSSCKEQKCCNGNKNTDAESSFFMVVDNTSLLNCDDRYNWLILRFLFYSPYGNNRFYQLA